MPLPFLNLLPDQTGYRVTFATNTVGTDLVGGQPRVRLDVLNGSGTVDLQWTCDPLRYNYLTAFQRTSVSSGSEQFNIELIMDNDQAQMYVATFVPGTFGLIAQQGLTYIVGASLYVIPLPVDPTHDQALVDVYSSYADSSDDVLAALAALVNSKIPSANV